MTDDGQELPPELEQMIDEYDGDMDEYAAGVYDTWLHLQGRTPEYSGRRQRRNAEIRRREQERLARRAQIEAEVPF